MLIVVPNSFSSEFAFASSSTGYVGMPQLDALDMYNALMQIITQTEVISGIEFQSKKIIGYSMGGLYLGYLMVLDAQFQTIRFDKALMINPPISIVHGMKTVDKMYEERKKFSALERGLALVNIYFKKAFYEKIDPLNMLHFGKYVESLKSFSQEEMRFILGWSFNQSVTDVVMATQDILDLGILPKKPTRKRERSLGTSENTKDLSKEESVLLKSLA